MRELLTDVVRNISGLYETVKVIGTASKTIFQAADTDRTFMLVAEAKAPAPELIGEFGMTHLPVLKGLLDFPAFKEGSGTMQAHRRPWRESDTVESITFKGKKGGAAQFRCMSADLVQDLFQLEPLARIPWDITVSPEKTAHAEFVQLAGVYGKVDTLFATTTEGSNLMFGLGDENASTHKVSMVYAEDVSATLRPDLLWDRGTFQSIVRTAGDNPWSLKISNKGILGIEISSDHTLYKYYIRCTKR